MNNVHYVEKDQLFPIALSKLESINTLLDIGCGVRPQQYVEPKVHICCEPFQQYVEHLQREIENDRSDREYVVLKATWAEAMKLFPDRSVDSIFLLDVVEHLEKQESLDLINQSLRKIKKQIAIFTPLGFLPQSHPDGKDGWGLDGGAWQEHKSGWQPEDFDESWEIYVAKVFHTIDGMGKAFDTPYGALWAIKTISAEDRKNTPPRELKKIKRSKRQMVHRMVDKALDLFTK